MNAVNKYCQCSNVTAGAPALTLSEATGSRICRQKTRKTTHTNTMNMRIVILLKTSFIEDQRLTLTADVTFKKSSKCCKPFVIIINAIYNNTPTNAHDNR